MRSATIDIARATNEAGGKPAMVRDTAKRSNGPIKIPHPLEQYPRAILHNSPNIATAQATIVNLRAHIGSHDKEYLLLYLCDCEPADRNGQRLIKDRNKHGWDFANADAVASVNINTQLEKAHLLSVVSSGEHLDIRTSLTPIIEARIGVVQDNKTGRITGICPPLRPNQLSFTSNWGTKRLSASHGSHSYAWVARD